MSFLLMLLIAIGCLISVFAMEIAIRKPVTMDTIVAHEIGCGATMGLASQIHSQLRILYTSFSRTTSSR